LGILLALAWQKKHTKSPKHRSIGPLFRPELGVIKASLRLASVPKSPFFWGEKFWEILRGTCGQGKPQHVICICDIMWPWFVPPVFSLILYLWKWPFPWCFYWPSSRAYPANRALISLSSSASRSK
jgi:hypothetical protein